VHNNNVHLTKTATTSEQLHIKSWDYLMYGKEFVSRGKVALKPAAN
jgi:hypothetical protein